MKAFDFKTVPHVSAEIGAARQLGQRLGSHFDARRPLLVTDGGLVKAGLVAPIIEQLAGEGFTVRVFDGVVADPPEEVVFKAIQAFEAHGADLVVGLGGGSAMDVAKLVAVLARSDQPLADMYGVGNVRGRRAVPLVQVPTTAGTGAEVTPVAIVTTGATTKMGVVDPALFADMAILDAELTLGLPASVTAATGIDAMVHAIEAFTSKRLKNPMSDMLAREALRLLVGSAERAVQTGQDIKPRQDMLLGAMLAGQAFTNAPVGGVHALAYPLGGLFHVSHGLSNALVLPHVLRFNRHAAAPLYAELAGVLVPGVSGGDDMRAEVFIEALEDMCVRLGVPRRLRDVGVGEEDVNLLASDAMLQERLLINNPRPISEAEARALYEAAW